MTTLDDLLRADVERAWQLADIEVERGGDGRTVTAYATPFDEENEIHDEHGHYFERFSRRSFDKTAAEATRSGVIVLYNHGKDLDGQSHGAFQVPIGRPVEVRPDGRGLLTRTEFLRTGLADTVLEAIRAGAVSAYSHTSQILRARQVGSRDGVPVIEHLEARLREYGPTPLPFVTSGGARILSVRSQQLAERLRDVDAGQLDQMDPGLRAELARILDVEPASLSDQTEPAIVPDKQPQDDVAPADPPAPKGPDLGLLAAANAARRRR